jgi:hypothetical protein
VAGSITQDIGESKVLVGDGIDDIVDVLLDKKDVLWRFNNTGVADVLCFEREVSVSLGAAFARVAVVSARAGIRR